MLPWLLAIVVAPSVVSAQTGGEVQPAEVRRPFRGLFGAPSTPGSRQSLDFTASLYGAYDDDVYADQRGVTVSSSLRKSGTFGGLETGLNYARRGRRIGFGADAALGGRDIPRRAAVRRLPDECQLQRAARAPHQSRALGRRSSTRRSSASACSSTDSNSRLFEDPFGSITPGLGVFREHSYRNDTNVGVTQTFRDESSLSGFYSVATANYESDDLDYINQGAGARYQRRVTRNAGFHAGYTYGRSRYPNMATPEPPRDPQPRRRARLRAGAVAVAAHALQLSRRDRRCST